MALGRLNATTATSLLGLNGKILLDFLSLGSVGDVRGKCMVEWATCAPPTVLSGLGMTDLRLADTAFQAKWLWMHRTDHGRAWAELPLRTSKQARAFFTASRYVHQLGQWPPNVVLAGQLARSLLYSGKGADLICAGSQAHEGEPDISDCVGRATLDSGHHRRPIRPGDC